MKWHAAAYRFDWLLLCMLLASAGIHVVIFLVADDTERVAHEPAAASVELSSPPLRKMVPVPELPESNLPQQSSALTKDLELPLTNYSNSPAANPIVRPLEVDRPLPPPSQDFIAGPPQLEWEPEAVKEVVQKRPVIQRQDDIAVQAASEAEGDSDVEVPRSSGKVHAQNRQAAAQEDGFSFHKYLQEILEEIEKHKRYPYRARSQRTEGQAVVAFTLYMDGSIDDVRIAAGAGAAELDRASLLAVRKAAPFRRPPRDFAERPVNLEVVISFKLNR